jgi:NarL family two-component system response regulator LiaR
MQKTVSVALVDDHTIVRQGMRAFLMLEPGLVIVAEGNSGESAINIASKHHPNVMLLDLMMPGINGIEATRQVKQVSPQTQIVILTSYLNDEHIVPALQAGALSYLLKDIDPDSFIDAIYKAARGESMLNPRLAARVVQEVSKPKSDSLSQLSEREYEVLLLIAHGHSNAHIAERLIISERTVKSHVSSILSKLGMTDRTQLAVYAWQRGLISRFAHKDLLHLAPFNHESMPTFYG